MKILQEKLNGTVVWICLLDESFVKFEKSGKRTKKYDDILQVFVDNIRMAGCYRCVIDGMSIVVTDYVIGNPLTDEYTPPMLKRRIAQNHLSMLKGKLNIRLVTFFMVADKTSREVAENLLGTDYDEFELDELKEIQP